MGKPHILRHISCVSRPQCNILGLGETALHQCEDGTCCMRKDAVFQKETHKGAHS